MYICARTHLSTIFISLPPYPPHTHIHFATSVDLRKASCTDYTVFTRVANRNILTPPVASKKKCHFHPALNHSAISVDLWPPAMSIQCVHAHLKNQTILTHQWKRFHFHILSTGLKSNHDQVCVCVRGWGVRLEGGWKSLTGIVLGEKQLFGVWWVI